MELILFFKTRSEYCLSLPHLSPPLSPLYSVFHFGSWPLVVSIPQHGQPGGRVDGRRGRLAASLGDRWLPDDDDDFPADRPTTSLQTERVHLFIGHPGHHGIDDCAADLQRRIHRVVHVSACLLRNVFRTRCGFRFSSRPFRAGGTS